MDIGPWPQEQGHRAMDIASWTYDHGHIIIGHRTMGIRARSFNILFQNKLKDY